MSNPQNKYVVRLTEEERAELDSLVRVGRVAAYRRRHAQILLKADEGVLGPRWSDRQIAEAFEVQASTVHDIRRRFVEQSLEAAVGRKKRALPPRPRKLDGAAEARLLALACSEAPEGRTRWTLSLLADRLVELQIVDSIGLETVRQTLKKMRSNHT